MAVGGAAASLLRSNLAATTGATQTIARPAQRTPDTREQNRVPGREGEEEPGLLPGQQPANDQSRDIKDRPERQKLREQRVPTPRAETARVETTTTAKVAQPEEGPQAEGPKGKENRVLRGKFQDNTWQIQTRFDGQTQQPQLSDMGNRRMQAFYLHRLVNDCYQQHTGGKADEGYSRSQYRQILGALSTLGASNSKKPGDTRNEPTSAAALGKKMNDANKIMQIFEPPPPPPTPDYEPLEMVA